MLLFLQWSLRRSVSRPLSPVKEAHYSRYICEWHSRWPLGSLCCYFFSIWLLGSLGQELDTFSLLYYCILVNSDICWWDIKCTQKKIISWILVKEVRTPFLGICDRSLQTFPEKWFILVLEAHSRATDRPPFFALATQPPLAILMNVCKSVLLWAFLLILICLVWE